MSLNPVLEAEQHNQDAEIAAKEKEKIENFGKGLMMKAAATAMLYPLAHIKVLMQLGYEPFPLVLGKKFGIGREVYFLPNAISYARSLARTYKWTCLFNGLDAHICHSLVSNSVEFFAVMYLDRYYPQFGGDPVNLTVSEDELDDADSARRALRSTIRTTAARSVALVIARPFAVITIRKVAQVIGGELKYTDAFSSFLLIGREEGPKGLFSGLVPQLIGEFFVILGINGFIYLAERFLKRAKIDRAEEGGEDMLRSTRMMLHWTTPLIVNTVVYPFNVVSTVMAVAGSGLAASMLPYTPLFGMWQDAWNYLDIKQGLKRGARIFLREYTGPISVGQGGNVYAVNKHFV